MKNITDFTAKALKAVIAASLAITPSISMSQNANGVEGANVLEEVVVTGTRREGQSYIETLSPIDVLTGAAIDDQATFDLTDGITKVVPSINTQRYPIADGTAFIRPVTIRNLSPDHTLVLVNETRRHRSPLVNLQIAPLGTVNQGAHAVDFASLPAAAIKRIEILRDGASAQYGSDAIAGVMNVILKDADEGFSVSAQGGEYYEGDGTRYIIDANGGISLGGRGFLNGTFEYSSADKTDRGIARPDATQVANAVGVDLVPLDGKGQRWGDPDIETYKLFFNGAYDLTDNIEFFANVGYTTSDTISDFFYRGPVLPPTEMFTARSTLQMDTDGDFLPDPAPVTLVDDITASGLNPTDYLTADPTSPSGFVLLNPIHTMFPGGYNPNFGTDITDESYVTGLRGEIEDWDFKWDFTGRFQESEVVYRFFSETINPSLGGLSPTEFTPGTLTQEEIGINADFIKTVTVTSLASPLNIAFGFEYREETYTVGAGDQASIVAGPTAAFFGVGSDGFQGFPTESAGTFDSEHYAAYLDLEADVTERLSLGGAIRYEDISKVGDTFDWKVAGRFAVNDNISLRATVNTGFRAPTPGQVNTLNITTSADTAGNLIPNGTYPVAHPVARTLGAVPLIPEESISFTVGTIFTPFENTNITIDYYDIEIEDRLALRNFTLGATEVAALTTAGIPNANLLSGSLAGFFVNGFDSNVTGIDFALTSDFEIGPGVLTFDIRHNFNEQEVSNVATGTINASRVFDLENQVPEHRTTATFNYQTDGIFDGYIRLNRYGKWKTTGGIFSPGDASDTSTYGSEIIVDIEATLTFQERFKLSVGGENILDNDPDDEQDPVFQYLGVVPSLTSPFGFNGGFWYVRLGAEF